MTVSGDGTKVIDVRQTDSAGNLSGTNRVSFTLDTAVAAPILKLASDAGISATDRITNNGNVLFTNLETNATATWQYSKDGGTTWLTQTGGTTLNLNTDPTNHTSDGTYQIRLQQIDAAGNISQFATTNLTLDTAAPTLSMGTISGDGVLSTAEAQKDLVLSGATDAESGQIVTVTLADKTATGTILKTYTGVVSGGTWSVTVPASDVASFSSSITYHFAASVSDVAGNTVVQIPAGDLALAVTNSGLDGYITGATVFVDNKDVASGGHVGVLDAGEAVSLTDAVGSFSLPANGPLVMQGGIDVSTGLEFQSKYEASAGYRVINPVTTLIREYEIAHPVSALVNGVSSIDTKASTAAAVKWVKDAGLLGSTNHTSAADLSTYDPFRAATAADGTVTDSARLEAIAYQKVAAELSNVMDVGAAFLQTLKAPSATGDAQLAMRQDYSVALIKQIALNATSGDLALELADGRSTGLVYKALSAVASNLGLDSAQIAKLQTVATTLGQVNTSIDAIASTTGSVTNSTQAVSALANIIRAQGAVRGDLVETKLLDYAKGFHHDDTKNTDTTVTSFSISDAELSAAIAATPVGMIVPARVSVGSVVPGSPDFAQLEGNEGDKTAFTITLTRAGNIESVVSLDYKVNPGTGMTGADFVGGVVPNGTVTFAAGQSSVNVTIYVQGDTAVELDESFGVVISDSMGQTQLFDSSGQQVSFLARSFTVLNDDPFVPQVTAPATIDLGTGIETTLSGFSLDYYKHNSTQVLTVKVSSVASATFNDSGIQATAFKGVSLSHVVETQNNLKVLTLTGTLEQINVALGQIKLTVPSSETNAFVLVDATDGMGGAHGKAEIPLALHHPAQLVTAALPTGIVAGATNTLTGYSVSDVDGGVLTVTLDPTNMTLQVPAVTGVATTLLDSGGFTLVGKAVDINNALSSLTYTTSAGEIGLSASVTDSDPYSLKPAAVSYTATAVNASTVLQAPDHLVGSAGTAMVVGGLNLSDLDSKSVTVDISATHGTLSLAAVTGVDVRQIDAAHYTVSGALTNVNSVYVHLHNHMHLLTSHS